MNSPRSLAEIVGCGRGVEEQPRPARVRLLGEVKSEGGVVHRLGRVFEKVALTGRGDASLRIVEVLFGEPGAPQKRPHRDVALPQRRNRAADGEPRNRRLPLGRALGHRNPPNY